ncbi:DUF4430 domain-containing protein [Clostridium sp. MSJ-4]|uniref:DUF4430 domain-containing protein n=1 Tax=Clostridium simiarum TaxID=2841506 RepID=A0ABS6EW50_9CLOT|nr:DUF4430 domain-containing protein [Clostridium simiarum]MBU5590436.1 DUF4430 domain-containing protein [Clostridium simiarum]
MKKKLPIFIIVILISVGALLFSRFLINDNRLGVKEEKYEDSSISTLIEKSEENNDKVEEIKEESTEDKNSNTENEKSSSLVKEEPNKVVDKNLESNVASAKVTNENNKNYESEAKAITESKPLEKPKEPEKKQEPNVRILDEANGTNIISDYVQIEGKTVEDATKEILNKNSINYVVKAGYFSSISGIKERSAGKASGWCYYVNGNKPGVGASAYVLKAGDKLTWKFLKDGIND